MPNRAVGIDTRVRQVSPDQGFFFGEEKEIVRGMGQSASESLFCFPG
jgi:hypothetical protein